MTINITDEIPMEIGSIPYSIPHAVAAPLPPLKLAKIGNMWPATAKSPQVIFKKASASQPGGAIGPLPISKASKATQYEAANPFIKSSTNTLTPDFHPKFRKALVVPRFPLPKFRISILWNICPTHNDDGIDPKT